MMEIILRLVFPYVIVALATAFILLIDDCTVPTLAEYSTEEKIAISAFWLIALCFVVVVGVARLHSRWRSPGAHDALSP